MAGERLQWTFELLDRITGPAGKAGAAMAKLETGLHASGSALNRFHDIVELAYEAPKVLAEVWESVSERVREAIAEMRFKQGNLIALEALTGSAEKAREIFEGVEDFAYKTGKSVKDTMELTKSLASAGFDEGSIVYLRKLLGDMAVVDPGRATMLGEAISFIGHRGELTQRSMLQLAHTGLNLEKVWEGLSAELGIPVEALKSMSGLKVAAGTAIAVITKVAADKFSGGVAGSLLEKERKTTPALLDRIRSIPGKIMDELQGLDYGKGGGPFNAFLENMANAFDPSSAEGKAIHGAIKGFVIDLGKAFGIGDPAGLFAQLAGPEGPAKIKEIMLGIVEWGRTDLIPFLLATRDVVLEMVSGIKSLGGAVERLKSPLGGMTTEKGQADYMSEFNSANGRVQTSRAEAIWYDLFRTSTNESDPDSWLNRKRREVAANGGPATVNVNVSIAGTVAPSHAKIIAGGVTSGLEQAGLAVGGK